MKKTDIEPETLSNPATPVAEGAEAKSAHPKRPLWRNVTVAVVVVLAIGAGTYAYMVRPAANTPSAKATPKPAAPKDYTFAPRFTQVTAYTKYKGAEWYAVPAAVIKVQAGKVPQYFSHKDGLPLGAATGFAIHNDTLWVSTQAGTATLKPDSSGFTEIPVGNTISTTTQLTANGKIYKDASSRLILSTFTNFYVYNDAGKTWGAMTGVKPINASNIVSNENYSVANANSSGSPVWVYSKKTGTWTEQGIPAMSDQTSSVFALGNELFIMGRQAGYSSCGQAGKLTATVAYRLDVQGAWQPMKKFNADVARPELHYGVHVKGSPARVYTSSCDQGAQTKTYALTHVDNDLRLSDEKLASDGVGGFMGDDGDQQSVVDELSKATGLYPYTQPKAVDKDGNIVFGFSTKSDFSTSTFETGLAVAKGSDLSQSKAVAIEGFRQGQTAEPILCDGQFKYLFVGTQEAGHGGPTLRWETAKIHTVHNGKTASFVDLQRDVSQAHFSCSEGKLSWLGRTSINQLDLKTKQLTSVGGRLGADLTMTSGQSHPLGNGDLWVLAEGRLSYYNRAKATVTKLADVPVAADLQAASPAAAWLTTISPVSTKSLLTMYGKDGKTVYTKMVNNPIGVTATGETGALVVSASAVDQAFPLSRFAHVSPSGNEATILPASIAMHSYSSRESPGGLTDGLGMYDASRKRVWLTDLYLGAFAVHLRN